MNKPAVAAGPTVKTTVVRTTEEIPDSSERAPELWSYIESILSDWGDHSLYVYRDEPKMQGPYSSEPTYIDRSFDGTIAMPNGTSVPFSADAIKEKFGGRVFRFILKKGSQRVTQGRLATEAAPRYPEMNPGSNSPLPNAGNYGQQGHYGQDGSTQVAMRAIDTVSAKDSEGVTLAINALRAASEMLKTNTPAADPLRDRLMDIMIQRLLDPPKPPDSLELILRAKELFTPPAPTNSLQQTIEFIGALKTSGLISIGGGRAGMWDLAAQALPQVAGAAVEGIREWRMGMEAQSRAMIATRGGVQPNPPQLPPAADESQRRSDAVQQTVEGQPQATAASSPDMANAAPPLEWIETRIAAILKDLNSTVDEQVDRVLDFLELSNPDLIAGLLNPPSIHPSLPPGEKGILMLFQNRPILQKVPVNPRLTEFIKKFIVAAQEYAAPTPGPQPVPSPQKPA